nr:immunoglobulin heavy chain junction region [Macaca mulatta]MOV40676.1 immunoglobulin heavy chain junction region [Macaca mulatta]MOV40977.1 immunoglobulin heavy chain junction region [Macaca mulatta]MOV42925.1 immunoglobulin heavy chain junction region [Macaca mulatta]MOV44804.1 immunoglobulin heavy chain junction region [Macaca mulatta]
CARHYGGSYYLIHFDFW